MGLVGTVTTFFFGCTVSMKDLRSPNWGLNPPHTHIWSVAS